MSEMHENKGRDASVEALRLELQRGMRRLWVAVLVLGALVLGLVGRELWERDGEGEEARGPKVVLNPLPPEVRPRPTNERQGTLVRPVAEEPQEVQQPSSSSAPPTSTSTTSLEVPKVGNYEIGTPTEINPDEKKPAVEMRK